MAPTPHHLQPLLVFTLQNPMNPRAPCIYGLYSAVVQIFTCGSALPYHVPFLRAAMEFMTTSRTAGEHTKLKARLLQCHCNRHDPNMIQLHHPPPPALTASDIYELTILALTKMLTTAIIPFNPRSKGEKKRWPASIQDILPDSVSASQLCDAILQWAADGSSGSGCFTLLGTIVGILPAVRAHVLSTPRIAALATTHLEHALGRVPAQNQHTGDLWAPRFTTAVFACAGTFLYVLMRSGAGLDTILAGPGIRSRMYQVALHMQPHLYKSKAEGDMSASCAWFDGVCRQHGHAFVPTAAPPPPVSNAEKGYLEHAWGFIVQMRNTGCAVPGCRPQDSHVCGACGVARYCSPEHQRISWKDGHKVMCPLIQNLRKAIHMEDLKAWTQLIHDTQAGRSSLDFRRMCARYNVDPQLGGAILKAAGFPLLAV
ncbi:hypothetical protein B0H11DRAFT_2430219 [Mycena galericulata]|nr:hypothetical protein B0H11DRAFT_2430219 [Mycena galericulata]